MSRRFVFLSGHFIGLLTGASIVWAYYYNKPAVVKIERVPVYQIASPATQPKRPENSQDRPSFEFNGKPVFIIPLAQSGPLQDDGNRPLQFHHAE